MAGFNTMRYVKNSRLKNIFRSRLSKIRFKGSSFVLAIPYIWLILFFIIPFLIIFKISFSEMVEGTMPPYTPIFSYEDGKLDISLNFNNYKAIFAGDDLGLDEFDDESEQENTETDSGLFSSVRNAYNSISDTLSDNLYLQGYWQSLKVAFVSTFC